MAWWGTMIGGTLGFMFGGPLGAVLGAVLGSNLSPNAQSDGLSGGFAEAGNQQRVQAAFFTATFSVMGHIAKADGKVSAHEISATEQLMTQMGLTDEQRKTAIKLFEQGKSANFPLKDILLQFKKECHRRRNLIQMFVEIQISTALSDGILDANEKRIIYFIGDILNFSQQEIEHLFNLAKGASASTNNTLTLDGAYKILGITNNSTQAEVKKAYRRLMSQHHPDKLVSKGLPEEMITLATKKTQEIRQAYEKIKAEK